MKFEERLELMKEEGKQKHRFIQTKHVHNCWLQSNKAAIDYGLKSLQFLFILNGAAGTASLAAQKSELLSSIFLFGLGAASSILALGISYFLLSLITTSFEVGSFDYDPKELDNYLSRFNCIKIWAKKLQLAVYISSVLSLILFIVALKCAVGTY